MPARKTKADMMAFMRELIKEVPEGARKILFAFDLDDTLIRTDSSVIVRNGRSLKKLSPAEYAIYEPKPRDEFDFIEFKRIKNPKIIKSTFDLFTKVLTASYRIQNAKTIILTARSQEIAGDLETFLKSKGLKGVELFAVGSSDPKAKSNIIQDFIEQGYNTIRFYDDSPKNVAAVKALGATNPKADIMTKLIKHDVSESEDRIPGGIAQGKTLTDLVRKIDPKGYYFNQQLLDILKRELAKGVQVEMEHTTDIKIAKEIAMDHMFEDPKYYTKMEKAGLEENIVKYRSPSFEYEWTEAMRYPEFKKMGKEKWIEVASQGKSVSYSDIKDILGNVDLEFDKLEDQKKQRFQKAFEDGRVEMPIAVKFSNDDYDLVAGNTRVAGLVKNRIDPKIWVVDVSNVKEEKNHEPMNPGILKRRLGKLSCSKVKEERAKLKDKGTTYAKALQRYINYHCND
jgi:hypothetical protein